MEHKLSVAGAAFARFNWTHDKAGNRVAQSDFDGSATTTQQFEYDKAHRLVRETPRAGATPTAYQYDGPGNRLRTSDGQALVANESAALIWTGTPTHVADSNASGGSYARLGSGVSADLAFTGDAISFVYNMSNDDGTVRLTLDPGPSQIVLADINQCLSGPGTTYQNQKTFTGFAPALSVCAASTPGHGQAPVPLYCSSCAEIPDPAQKTARLLTKFAPSAFPKPPASPLFACKKAPFCTQTAVVAPLLRTFCLPAAPTSPLPAPGRGRGGVRPLTHYAPTDRSPPI